MFLYKSKGFLKVQGPFVASHQKFNYPFFYFDFYESYFNECVWILLFDILEIKIVLCCPSKFSIKITVFFKIYFMNFQTLFKFESV